MTSTKLLALCAFGVCLLAGTLRAEEPTVRADAAVKAEPARTDRSALRAELVKEVAAARAERRQELRSGDRPQAAGAASERIAEAQKRRDAKSARRDDSRPTLREMQREHRDEQREVRRSLIRRTQ